MVIPVNNFSLICHEWQITEFQCNDLIFSNKCLLVEFEVEQPNELIVTEGPFMQENYKFLQLHFHWGSKNKQGCEHTIEGKR